MSKEETGQGKDQEFAFSKYAEKKDLSTEYSDFRAQDLDLKNHQVGYVPVASSHPQYSQLAQAEEATAKNAQIDISDLKIMREQLNKILELPECHSDQSQETTVSQGLGDMSFFKGISDQKTTLVDFSPTVKGKEEPVFGKKFSPQNPPSFQNVKELPSNVVGEWNSSDAELLARSYEKLEASSQPSYPSKTNARAYNSTPPHSLRSSSRQISPLYNSQAIAEAIADQKWLNQSSLSGEVKPKSSLKTPITSSRSDVRAKEQLEAFWQRLDVVLKNLVLQTKAQTKQLLDTHTEETLRHYEKLEQQISVVQDLLRKVHSFIEKFEPKNQMSSHDKRQINEQDLNSVLFSIDEDLSQTFGFKQQKISYHKTSSDLDQQALSDRQNFSYAYNDQVALKLDNLQKILLRLLDRLEVPPTSNAKQSALSQVTNKMKLSKQRKGLLSNFKLSWAKIFSAPQADDPSLPLMFDDYSNVSRIQKSSHFGLRKNSSLTIIALFFVIALSSASLVINSSKSSFASRNLSTQTLTSSESNADVFPHADHLRLPFITNSTPKQIVDQNESHESQLLPSVSEEFFEMSATSSAHF